jgi:predicted lipopolysaccharide heptosyltransferase III
MPSTLHAPPRFEVPLAPCNLPVSRCTVSREAASRRILIMRLGAYGDILMGTPLLAALRAAYPDAYLTWMAGPTETQAIDANPYIDEVIVWDGAYIRSAWRHGRVGPAIVRSVSLLRELRRRRYDAFISLQPEEWPLLLRAVGAAQNIGVFNTFARHWGEERNPHYQTLYTQAYSRPELHRIDQYLAVLEAFGLPKPADPCLSIGYTAEDKAASDSFLAAHGNGESDDFIVVAPLTTWPTKCWAADRYAALGDALAKAHGCRIVLIGTAKEGETLAQIASAMSVPAAVAAGSLTFRQSAALIARSRLLVSGDTGPMHVAAAVGTPQVALFGATSPLWYGPRTERSISLLHEVPCGPCDKKECSQTGADYLRCLDLITVGEALAAAGRLLAGVK